MILKILLLALCLMGAAPAHAGWLRDFIKKCEQSLVMEDPYQFQETDQRDLERELERLKIQKNWNRATELDLTYLKIIEDELAFRQRLKQMNEQQGAAVPQTKPPEKAD